jgi:GDP-L-fucose synthase
MGKLLVTGTSGLVGSEFKGDLISITSKVGDLRDKKIVDDIFSFYSDKERQKENVIDKVIHCAAKVGGLGGNMNAMGQYFYDNLMINTNVIESCRKHDIKKLLVFSSTCVFPADVEYPLTEDKIHLGPPHETNYGYAYAKRMADIQIAAYNQEYNTKYFSVIPCNMYGPNDNYNLETSHVIPSLIHKVYLAKLNNTDVTVWGSGKSLREFIFSKDVAKISEILIDTYNDTKPIILSTSNEVSIEEVIVTICEIMDFKNNIIFDKSKPEGQFRKPADNSYLKSIIGDYQFTNLREGLEETIKYFIANYNNIRK